MHSTEIFSCGIVNIENQSCSDFFLREIDNICKETFLPNLPIWFEKLFNVRTRYSMSFNVAVSTLLWKWDQELWRFSFKRSIETLSHLHLQFSICFPFVYLPKLFCTTVGLSKVIKDIMYPELGCIFGEKEIVKQNLNVELNFITNKTMNENLICSCLFKNMF